MLTALLLGSSVLIYGGSRAVAPENSALPQQLAGLVGHCQAAPLREIPTPRRISHGSASDPRRIGKLGIAVSERTAARLLSAPASAAVTNVADLSD